MRDFYFYTDMSTPDRPIGFFDSGIGGISIWKEVIQLLPNESCMYLADSKNAPYGMQSKEDIIQFSIKNTEFLLNQNAKVIVVAVAVIAPLRVEVAPGTVTEDNVI